MPPSSTLFLLFSKEKLKGLRDEKIEKKITEELYFCRKKKELNKKKN